MLALNACTPEALASAVPPLSLAEARKVVSAVHRGKPLARLPQVRRVALDAVLAQSHLPRLTKQQELSSAVDPFVKLSLATHDGHVVEAVRIPLEKPGRYSACISSQAGCALACTFCATGRLGLRRNLEAHEMVDQVTWIRDSLPNRHVHGVLFQGMGEPLANLDRVLQAIAVLTEPCAMAVDTRNVTVSTAGLPAGIRRLAREAPKVRLAVSVHTADPTARQQLMPIHRAHPLEEVLDAGEEHARVTGLAPLWAVTLLAGKNDSDDHARALGELARGFQARCGVRPRLSIITYNAIGGDDPFSPSSPARLDAFRQVLHGVGVPTNRRYSGGPDIGAACGQLAGAALGG